MAAASAPSVPPAPNATAPGSGPASTLSAGVAAFFRGDVDASIRALELEPATAESLAVLACALATRSLLSADAAGASADLDRARGIWLQAQRMRPQLSLGMKWVSPRVRAVLS